MIIHPLDTTGACCCRWKKGEVVEAHGLPARDLRPGLPVPDEGSAVLKQRFAAFDFDYPEGGLEADIVARGRASPAERRRSSCGWAPRPLKGHRLEGVSRACWSMRPC